MWNVGSETHWEFLQYAHNAAHVCVTACAREKERAQMAACEIVLSFRLPSKIQSNSNPPSLWPCIHSNTLLLFISTVLHSCSSILIICTCSLFHFIKASAHWDMNSPIFVLWWSEVVIFTLWRWFEVLMKLLSIHASIHPSIYPGGEKCPGSYSFISVKSHVNLPFLSCWHQRWTHAWIWTIHRILLDTTHMHTHTCTHRESHPFTSDSDELLSCLLDIGSMQPQSRLVANHRTMGWALTLPAFSAFANSSFSRWPSENLGVGWLCEIWWAGCKWKSKKSGEAERQKTLTETRYEIICFK